MRILVFDPFHGAAGDMITAALIDMGADREAVIKAMSSVVAAPDIIHVKRCGISATGIRTNSGPARRSLEEVLDIVGRSDAPPEAVEMAKHVFERIAGAETQIHGENPHFHEVGADDAIADVIGACTALYTLKPGAVAVMPVATGTGCIESEHGHYPNPAPATLEILKEGRIPAKITGENSELCTPTGAALLSEFRTTDNIEISGPIVSIGYGAGKRDPEDTPNVLRVFIIDTGEPSDEFVDILETNVDDVSGEIIAHVIRKLIDEGARDACAIPVIMKKGRPGYIIKVICSSHDVDSYTKILSEELGTLGIRHMQNVHRSIIERKIITVPYDHEGNQYPVRVKIGSMDGKPVTVKAEYEDLKEVASSTGIPLKRIALIIENKALENF